MTSLEVLQRERVAEWHHFCCAHAASLALRPGSRLELDPNMGTLYAGPRRKGGVMKRRDLLAGATSLAVLAATDRAWAAAAGSIPMSSHKRRV